MMAAIIPRNLEHAYALPIDYFVKQHKSARSIEMICSIPFEISTFSFCLFQAQEEEKEEEEEEEEKEKEKAKEKEFEDKTGKKANGQGRLTKFDPGVLNVYQGEWKDGRKEARDVNAFKRRTTFMCNRGTFHNHLFQEGISCLFKIQRLLPSKENRFVVLECIFFNGRLDSKCRPVGHALEKFAADPILHHVEYDENGVLIEKVSSEQAFDDWLLINASTLSPFLSLFSFPASADVSSIIPSSPPSNAPSILPACDLLTDYANLLCNMKKRKWTPNKDENENEIENENENTKHNKSGGIERNAKKKRIYAFEEEEEQAFKWTLHLPFAMVSPDNNLLKLDSLMPVLNEFYAKDKQALLQDLGQIDINWKCRLSPTILANTLIKRNGKDCVSINKIPKESLIQLLSSLITKKLAAR